MSIISGASEHLVYRSLAKMVVKNRRIELTAWLKEVFEKVKCGFTCSLEGQLRFLAIYRASSDFGHSLFFRVLSAILASLWPLFSFFVLSLAFICLKLSSSTFATFFSLYRILFVLLVLKSFSLLSNYVFPKFQLPLSDCY